MKQGKKEFGKFRSVIWPIHRSELKKVLSMLLLFFLLCACYSILRNLKDTVILTAKASGAEVIPFLKVWGMLPAALGGTWIYTRLCRRFTREKVFYIVLSGFLTYFLFFAFFLYPNREWLHLHALGDALSETLPLGFKGLIAMIRNWTFTTFYVISELWSILMLSVLFWGFANEHTRVSEAKRSYGILNIGSNLAPILGGFLAILFVSNISLPFFYSTGVDPLGETLIKLILLITVLSVGAMGIFYWIHRRVLPQEDPIDLSEHKPKKTMPRLSIRQSLKYISGSKYLISIALIVLGYNIAINITDILWKEQLKRHFTNPNDMLKHMNLITIGIGLIATHAALFFSIMVRKLGWTFIALLTPAIMSVMAVGFFTFLFTGDLLASFALSTLGASPLALTVYFGSMQNCLSKAGKYSVFDASKEIAFLPLDSESKIKGKAAIDGLGSGIGKSGASIVYQGLIIAFGSVALSAPYIACILCVIFVVWISSVFKLGRRFKEATALIEEPATVSLTEELAET